MTWWDNPIAIIVCPWKHDETTQLEISDCSLGGTTRTSIRIAIARGIDRCNSEDEMENLRGGYMV